MSPDPLSTRAQRLLDELRPWLKHPDDCGATKPPYSYCSCGLSFAFNALHAELAVSDAALRALQERNDAAYQQYEVMKATLRALQEERDKLAYSEQHLRETVVPTLQHIAEKAITERDAAQKAHADDLVQLVREARSDRERAEALTVTADALAAQVARYEKEGSK
jgi:regulator of replication initiation timing